jgi:DNA-directed RNA polymerase specialized sigma24 family protein
MSPSETATHPWADHFMALCREREERAGEPVEHLRRRIWQIIFYRLSRYLLYHTGRLGQCDPADLEDIASQKSLDLMRQMDMGSGRLRELAAKDVPSFLSAVARNGLADHLKSRGRMASSLDDEQVASSSEVKNMSAGNERPDTGVEQNEFTLALRGCVQALEPAARRAWFFRVFYEMPSKAIAAHPAVRLKASHIDVVLQRSRHAVRDCMKRRGFEPHDVPPGTFAALWRLFHPASKQSKEVT